MTLIYLADGPLFVDPNGRLGVFAKSLSGLAAYASMWPGAVYVSSMEVPEYANADRADVAWQSEPEASELSFIARVTVDDLRRFESAAVMHSVHGRFVEQLLNAGLVLILTDDWSPEVRLEVALVSASDRLDGARIRLGHWRRTLRIDRLAARASGFQCNGHDAGIHYKRVNGNTHQYFDHRITNEDLQLAERREIWSGERPLRIAYSGRMAHMKGAHLIPDFLDELDNLRVPFEFHLIGVGPQLEELKIRLGERAAIHGFVKFDPDWKSLVRTDVDLMFLPHLQGDSASTYFEALGSRVPILGFSNRTLTPLLEESSAGWKVPMKDVNGAAVVVAKLMSDPGALAEAGSKGIKFMRKHTFDAEFGSRVSHIVRTLEGQR